jgi:hypothetical protein
MMKKLAVVVVLILGGALVWSIGNRLSADAIGMGVGLLFGVLAGVPTALLVMAAGRRRAERDEEERFAQRRQVPQHAYGYPPYPQQPPIIVLAAPAAPQYPASQTVDSVGYPVRPALPGPGANGAPGGRAFKVVGEKEEWLDEW